MRIRIERAAEGQRKLERARKKEHMDMDGWAAESYGIKRGFVKGVIELDYCGIRNRSRDYTQREWQEETKGL